MKTTNKIRLSFEGYMTRIAHERTRKVLMGYSDRMLEDAGFSRALLDDGIKAWPWRAATEENTGSICSIHTRAGNRSAVRELQSYSNRELLDLGISRGSIAESVALGRADEQERKVA